MKFVLLYSLSSSYFDITEVLGRFWRHKVNYSYKNLLSATSLKSFVIVTHVFSQNKRVRISLPHNIMFFKTWLISKSIICLCILPRQYRFHYSNNAKCLRSVICFQSISGFKQEISLWFRKWKQSSHREITKFSIFRLYSHLRKRGIYQKDTPQIQVF